MKKELIQQQCSILHSETDRLLGETLLHRKKWAVLPVLENDPFMKIAFILPRNIGRLQKTSIHTVHDFAKFGSELLKYKMGNSITE